jgi:hypothetical protein
MAVVLRKRQAAADRYRPRRGARGASASIVLAPPQLLEQASGAGRRSSSERRCPCCTCGARPC